MRTLLVILCLAASLMAQDSLWALDDGQWSVGEWQIWKNIRDSLETGKIRGGVLWRRDSVRQFTQVSARWEPWGQWGLSAVQDTLFRKGKVDWQDQVMGFWTFYRTAYGWESGGEYHNVAVQLRLQWPWEHPKKIILRYQQGSVAHWQQTMHLQGDQAGHWSYRGTLGHAEKTWGGTGEFRGIGEQEQVQSVRVVGRIYGEWLTWGTTLEGQWFEDTVQQETLVRGESRIGKKSHWNGALQWRSTQGMRGELGWQNSTFQSVILYSAYGKCWQYRQKISIKREYWTWSNTLTINIPDKWRGDLRWESRWEGKW